MAGLLAKGREPVMGAADGDFSNPVDARLPRGLANGKSMTRGQLPCAAPAVSGIAQGRVFRNGGAEEGKALPLFAGLPSAEPPSAGSLTEQIEALRKEADRFIREFPERAAERRQRRALDAAEERKRTVLALLPEPNKPPALREWLAARTRFSNCLLGQALSGLIGEGRAERIHYPGGQSAYRKT